MKIVVASGKGGTGKTTVSVALALSLADDKKHVQLLDCDVEEPNAHLFIETEKIEEKKVSVLIPKIDKSKCDYCGKCSNFCVYNALVVLPNTALVFNEACHSCGGCKMVCPQNAITEEEKSIGKIVNSFNRNLYLSYGELNISQVLTPSLIRMVKKEGHNDKIMIIDAPPGASCPFVETVRQSDFCILVTEPTPFGLHDLKIAVEVIKKLNVPFGIIINRFDIGDLKVEEFCLQNNIEILMRIPNDRNIAIAYSNGIPMTKFQPEYKKDFLETYRKIYERTCNN